MGKNIAMVTTDQAVPSEVRLWQAVIVSAIEECVSGHFRRQREAEQFLLSDKSDFRFVCEAAGMDAESLRMRLAKRQKQSVMRVDCPVAAYLRSTYIMQ
jgi:hypothetical protein